MQYVSRRLVRFGVVMASLGLLMTLAIGGAHLTAASEHVAAPHPAHIHTGTCEALGDVVAPLNNISASYLMNGTPMAMAGMVGAESAIPVQASVTIVPMALADIVAGGHAINIHESAENIGNYIACGAIGGMMMGASDLPIGLAELNDSNYSGVAWLHDNGDGTTSVSVYLTATDDDDEDSADESAGGADSTAAVVGIAVDIKDFAFNPGTLDIAVGDTVTWTNSDSAPHTVTQTPSGGFQSGKLDTGMSFSQTFDTAGTFEYHCEFHDGMSGTIVVK